MPVYLMDCYRGGLSTADAVLRESVEIEAPGHRAAIVEAHRRAWTLEPTFLRDAKRRWDTVFYNSKPARPDRKLDQHLNTVSATPPGVRHRVLLRAGKYPSRPEGREEDRPPSAAEIRM